MQLDDRTVVERPLGRLRPRLSGLPRRDGRGAGAVAGDAGGRRRVRRERRPVRRGVRPARPVDRRRQPGGGAFLGRFGSRPWMPPARQPSPAASSPPWPRDSPGRRRPGAARHGRAVLPGRVASGAGGHPGQPARLRHGHLRRGLFRRLTVAAVLCGGATHGWRIAFWSAAGLAAAAFVATWSVRLAAVGDAGVAALPRLRSPRSADGHRRRRGGVPVRGDPVPHHVRRHRVAVARGQAAALLALGRVLSILANPYRG